MTTLTRGRLLRRPALLCGTSAPSQASLSSSASRKLRACRTAVARCFLLLGLPPLVTPPRLSAATAGRAFGVWCRPRSRSRSRPGVRDEPGALEPVEGGEPIPGLAVLVDVEHVGRAGRWRWRGWPRAGAATTR